MGRRVPRVEDLALLRGAGRFIDDIKPPGLLEAAFVRSPLAHALVRSVDAARARSLPGVRAVLTYADLRPLLTCERIPLALPSAAIRFDVDPFCLARDETCYVGEPIALVVAESRRIAEDAARLVDLDLEPLPAVIDPCAGLEPGAPKTRLDCPDNLLAHWVVKYGDVARAFAGAAHGPGRRPAILAGPRAALFACRCATAGRAARSAGSAAAAIAVQGLGGISGGSNCEPCMTARMSTRSDSTR